MCKYKIVQRVRERLKETMETMKTSDMQLYGETENGRDQGDYGDQWRYMHECNVYGGTDRL